MTDSIASITRLSNLSAATPQWLWESRIPQGKITLLAGPSGSGKSFLALHLAACISTARPFPLSENSKLNTENCGVTQAGSVLLVTPREDLHDVLLLRLAAAHADLAKITAISNPDLEHLKNAADQIPDLRLIIIDPYTFFSTSAQKLFALYQHVFARSVSILVLLPMRTSRNDPIHRIPFISDLAPLASIIFAVSPDHSEENIDPGRRILIQLKNNISPIVSPLVFKIENNSLAWTAENLTNQNVAEILSGPPRKNGPDPVQLERCAQWLCAQLHEKAMPQAQILQAALEAGFSTKTLYRTKTSMKIESKRDSEGFWVWRLPVGIFTYQKLDAILDSLASAPLPEPPKSSCL